ncbi:MAG: M48 family metallopeptidase [Gammaproteobacteria bacterium]|nr:M48 family metallopeptidase [Gammaproteobacteria bacterium]
MHITLIKPATFAAKTIVCALVTISLLSCATSPEGRKQFKLIPDDQMDAMGAQSFEQIKQQTPLTKDKNIEQYVLCIANKIIPQVQQSPNPQQWEVLVFEDDQANAFALPGNKIGVYTGLLKYAKNQDQLATVMGHEVAHVIAKHGNERVSSQLATQTGLGIAAAILGSQQGESNAMILAGLGLGVQFGITLPFSRKHESEADLIGLDLMAKAGFNPEESVPLWVNMSQAGGAPPEFMSTHPSGATRIKQLKERIPQANIAYQNAIKKGQRANCKL